MTHKKKKKRVINHPDCIFILFFKTAHFVQDLKQEKVLCPKFLMLSPAQSRGSCRSRQFQTRLPLSCYSMGRTVVSLFLNGIILKINCTKVYLQLLLNDCMYINVSSPTKGNFFASRFYLSLQTEDWTALQ